ncbi:glycine cleavage system protein H [Chryseobacterium sp. WG14]|uniref:glycine cleavage system protein H n=1 Tax=unclassified Chryseobacterium TaxID=2593645 RepID=UPI00211E23D4|nr:MULTISPECIES: glycine cleavage system protein H [unclassified Chryseobacterium]MCQ9637360.1 glycine cleavage system protein H [Chryseobacterium sp. WG23]MCQ9639544.1 glycine cleavage system protein H [Chryseobacterium sp. WG14]
MLIPKNLYYTKYHLWLRKIGLYDFCIGITDFAQKEIGEINLIEINLEEKTIGEKEPWGFVYGTHKTFPLILPGEFTITDVNIMLNEKPSHINIAPYSYWFLSISADICTSEFLTHKEYIQLIK